MHRHALTTADSREYLRQAARGFIASPPHHAILFDNVFTTAGVGHAVDANGKHYFTVIVIG